MHNALTTGLQEVPYSSEMAEDRIYKGRQPRRPHFIPQWAEKRGFKTQAELIKALGSDKSIVSRWYDPHRPTSPGVEWQAKLAALLVGDETETDSLFRHPDEDWLARFFRNRSLDEVERAKQMLEAAFPRSGKARKAG